MNCPNCNKEISPEWMLCPFCGHTANKCSNPTCDYKGWLPENAFFCPACGTPLLGKKPETHFNETEIKSSESELREIQRKYSQFHFPLPSEIPIRRKYHQPFIIDNLNPLDCGIILGWTTILEAAKHANGTIDTTYYKDICHTALVRCYGNSYWDIDGDGVIDTFYVIYPNPLPLQWISADIDFQMSYNEWLLWFTRNGFSYGGKNMKYSNNEALEFVVTANNNTTGMELGLYYDVIDSLSYIRAERKMSTLEKLII